MTEPRHPSPPRAQDPLWITGASLGTALLVALALLVTTPAARSAAELDGAARRVVSFMPALTETVAAVGAGSTLVGISDYCQHPPDLCAGLPRLGGHFDANLEHVLALEPDLVLLPEGLPGLDLRLQAAGVACRRFDTQSFASIGASFRSIGHLTGRAAEGDRLAEGLRLGLARLAAKGREAVAASGRPGPRALIVVHHLPDQLAEIWTAGRGCFLGEVLDLAGARNVITATGYQAIGREALVSLDPEVILDLFAPGTTEPPSEAAVQELWRQLPSIAAVRQGRVAFRTDNAYVAPGPRLVTQDVLDDFLHMIHSARELHRQ